MVSHESTRERVGHEFESIFEVCRVVSQPPKHTYAHCSLYQRLQSIKKCMGSCPPHNDNGAPNMLANTIVHAKILWPTGSSILWAGYLFYLF